eukprot:6049828-Alexandrium_andersonii.AAC.1
MNSRGRARFSATRCARKRALRIAGQRLRPPGRLYKNASCWHGWGNRLAGREGGIAGQARP